MLLLTLIGWVILTYFLAFVHKKIALTDRLSPITCWVALALSLGIFMPNIDWVEVDNTNFMWLNDQAQQQLTFVSEVAKQSNTQSTLQLDTLLLIILAVPAALRFFRVLKRYFQAKKLITNGVPYTDKSTLRCYANQPIAVCYRYYQTNLGTTTIFFAFK